ncbi:MAG: NUDIX hydrolase [Caldilineaceae bacterium]|nr:NUDIX hydrolase [Caldilineaceae bacterium]
MKSGHYCYCPYCATALEQRESYGQIRPVCPQCHFVQFQDPKVAVIGLVTHQQQVLLIRRSVDPGKGLWALPGGYMDAGEMPEAALQRELLEEVGLPVQIDTLLTIFPMVGVAGRTQGIVLAYHAVPAAATQTTLRCDDDACEAGWFSAATLPKELAFESTHTLLAQWGAQPRNGLAAARD